MVIKNKKLRIAILGDSISQGLGSKKYNYSQELKAKLEQKLQLECIIKNFAYTGTTILYANEIRENIEEFNPDIILSFYGSVDGMVRPKKKNPYWNLLPNRYKNNGMLDPRPFYSRNIFRSLIEHVDSYIRFHFKIILMRLSGTYSCVNIDIFEKEYRSLLEYFNEGPNFLIISTVYLDEYYFPGTNENYNTYNKCLKKLSEEYQCNFIDIVSLQKEFEWKEIYSDDHFHPNKKGYSWYATTFGNEIIRMLNK